MSLVDLALLVILAILCVFSVVAVVVFCVAVYRMGHDIRGSYDV